MIKVFGSNDWDRPGPDAVLVKLSRGGLVGRDLDEFVKRAGHHMVPYVDRLRPGEVAVHLNAMGATEAVGPNRHGDGFKEAALRRDHASFESGHVFRNHDNTSKSPRYGRVIKAAYHEPMRRVELLVGYFATKEAADRDGPLSRVADKEIAKIERGDALPVSMAVKVKHDVCAACGNKAANRSEYCDSKEVRLPGGRIVAACPRGGVKRAMCRVHDDGFMNHVDNPSPLRFFDISWVPRGADRTAYAFGVLGKAASIGDAVRGGAYIAETYGLRDECDPPPEIVAALHKLAICEAAAGTSTPFDAALVYRDDLPPPPPRASASDCWRALADRGVILPAADWLKLAAGPAAADYLDDFQASVGSAFGGLTASAAASPQYTPSDSPAPWAVQAWADKVAELRGMSPSQVADRYTAAVALGAPAPSAASVKQASSPMVQSLVDEYAAYAVQAAAAIAKQGRGFAATLLTRCNRLR